MNERTTEVLEQYELEVQSKRRGRGAWICETSQGLKLLREYKGTVKRLEFEEQIMNVLQNQKTCRTDQYMRNREGELLSVAEDGTRCVVKEWFSGLIHFFKLPDIRLQYRHSLYQFLSQFFHLFR